MSEENKEKGKAKNVRYMTVWEHRPIKDESFAPCPKPSTTANTPPKCGSGIIGSFDPPFPNGVGCEELIEMIKSSSEDMVRVNCNVVGFEKGTEISQSQGGIID